MATAPFVRGAVAARDGAIVAVGPDRDVLAEHADLPVRDLGEAVLVPGLVDAHCHLEWSVTGGLIPPTSFTSWLTAFLRFAPRLTPDDHDAAAALGALRALLAGTTAVADSGPTGAGAAALTRAGLRGVAHLEAFGRAEGAAARALAAETADRVAELEAGAGPRVAVGVSPHAPYTVGPALWAALAAHPGLAPRRWATHLAESAAESRLLDHGDGPLDEAIRARGAEPGRWPAGGPGPVARLAAAGALRRGLVAAHCVQLHPGDALLLASHGIGVAHCPATNAALRCGAMPLAALRASGAAVGLGTDSPASGGAYDVRAEARACLTAQGAAGGPAPGPAELMELATLGGARALGMDHLVGALTPGRRCDLVALTPPPDAAPGDPCAAALDARSAVTLVVVDGEEVLVDGAPIRLDPAEVLARAGSARGRLC